MGDFSGRDSRGCKGTNGVIEAFKQEGLCFQKSLIKKSLTDLIIG